MPEFKTDRPGIREIAFDMQPQEAKHWCWAANAASIANCYADHNKWTQCSVAGKIFDRQCCPRNLHPECNEESYLDVALDRTKNLESPEKEGPLSKDEIKDQIDQRRLIGVRIEWVGGLGHFITIHGYTINAGQFFVYIKDPQRPASLPVYSELVSHYQRAEGATWSHTYLTCPAEMENILRYSDVNEELSLKIDKLAGDTKVKKMGNKAHFKTMPKRIILPHDIYTIPFASLVDSALVEPRKTGYRLIDPSTKNNFLMFDFDNEKSNSSLQQVVTDNAFIDKYEQLARNNKIKGKALRVVRVPELGVEALWFHNDNKPGKDYVVPVNDLHFLPIDQPIPLNKFSGILHEAAISKSRILDKRYK